MRRSVTALAIVLAWALGGCGTIRDAMHPVFLSGEDARKQIESEVSPMIAARHPGIVPGTPRCPYLLNLTAGRTDVCVLPIRSRAMRVGIQELATMFLNQDVDALVERPDAERQIADALETQYGTSFTVRCDGDTLRIIPVGEVLECRVRGDRNPAGRVKATVRDRDGTLDVARLPNALTEAVRVLGRDAAEHRHARLVLSAPPVERYIAAIVGGERRHAELARRGLIGRAQCPPRMTLAGRKTATCTVQIGARTLRFTVRLDTLRRLAIEPAQQVVVVPQLREVVERYYAFRDRSKRKAPRARVDCGKPSVALVDDDDEIVPCLVRRGNVGRRITVKVNSDDGEVYDVPYAE